MAEERPIFLELDVVHPINGDPKRARVIVHVTYYQKFRGGIVRNRRIHVARNGNEMVGDEKNGWNEDGWDTRKSGRVEITACNLSPGEHLFEAWDHLTGKRVSRTLSIPKEKEKSPAEKKYDRAKLGAETAEANKRKREAEKQEKRKLIPHALRVMLTGNRKTGKYHLVIIVVAETGEAIPGTAVVIMDAKDPEPIKLRHVLEDGSCTHDIKVRERERFVSVAVPGGKKPLRWESRLFGPGRNVEEVPPLYQFPNH